MMRCAVIDLNSYLVKNIIVADASLDFAPEGCVLVQLTDEGANIGDIWAEGVFIGSSVGEVNHIPDSVTPRQVRLLLLSRGLLDPIEEIIAQQSRETRITWEFATEFRREDPLLKSLCASLGLSESQVDQFFIEAAVL